ncbi:MAG TPA: hypothetical protein VLL98_01560 [Rickettsiales bacterium]|nr:hypothetical protein [Rickettsiales bacterium]
MEKEKLYNHKKEFMVFAELPYAKTRITEYNSSDTESDDCSEESTQQNILITKTNEGNIGVTCTTSSSSSDVESNSENFKKYLKEAGEIIMNVKKERYNLYLCYKEEEKKILKEAKNDNKKLLKYLQEKTTITTYLISELLKKIISTNNKNIDDDELKILLLILMRLKTGKITKQNNKINDEKSVIYDILKEVIKEKSIFSNYKKDILLILLDFALDPDTKINSLIKEYIIATNRKIESFDNFVFILKELGDEKKIDDFINNIIFKEGKKIFIKEEKELTIKVFEKYFGEKYSLELEKRFSNIAQENYKKQKQKQKEKEKETKQSEKEIIDITSSIYTEDYFMIDSFMIDSLSSSNKRKYDIENETLEKPVKKRKFTQQELTDNSQNNGSEQYITQGQSSEKILEQSSEKILGRFTEKVLGQSSIKTQSTQLEPKIKLKQNVESELLLLRENDVSFLKKQRGNRTNRQLNDNQHLNTVS